MSLVVSVRSAFISISLSALGAVFSEMVNGRRGRSGEGTRL